MRCERLTLTADPAPLAAEIRAMVPAPRSVGEAVSQIIARVREEGDAAVRDYTRRFDGPVAALRVSAEELDAAAASLDPAVRNGLEQASDNVRRVAEAGLERDRIVGFGGHQVTIREAPIARAGIYVPGGRAPYPSTVVMGAVTARVAGVSHVAVCTPPGRDEVVLAACRLTGVSCVYRMGGAQAIAALAHGTETVEAVDVVVGPGNLYVQEAKLQLSGLVAIDAFAGPSDLLLIADGGSDVEPLVLDLLAQAEHGPGTLVVAASDSEPLLAELADALQSAPETGAASATVLIEDPHETLAFAQAFAPEHLQLVGAAAESLAPRITRAGCVFVGPGTGTAFGDYIAGSNHVLPTGGAARFASALNPATFRRRFTEVRVGEGAGELAAAAAPVARAEGFELHARSMEARIRDND
jgi:histidinol dehydrogenase